ncbi:hypothetical protein Tco_0261697 [Tanacetum coccineum]
MKDLGEATFILGIKIYRDRSKRLIGLGQNAYMDKILKRYKMDNSKCGHIPMQERLDLNKTQGASTPKKVKHMKNVPYASAVGSIMYPTRKAPSKVLLQSLLHKLNYIAASEAEMEAVWIRKFISGLGAPKAMGTGRGSKWITSDMVTDRASKAGRQVFNPKPVSEFNPIIGHVVPAKDKESDIVKDKESFVVKDKVKNNLFNKDKESDVVNDVAKDFLSDVVLEQVVANKLFSDVVKDRVLDDVVKDKESDVVKNVVNDDVKDVVSDVVLEQVVSNIKLSNVVSKKKTRLTELPKLIASVVADKHGVDVVSVYCGSGEVYGGPGEVIGFPTIVVVLPVIYGARMKRRWLLRFSDEGCGLSGKVFCVSGDGCCDSGEWVLVGDGVVLGG